MKTERLLGWLPFLWLVLLAAVPFILLGKVSVAEQIVAQPPFTPLFGPDGLQVSAAAYAGLTEDDLYLRAYLGSLRLAGIATLICLLMAYPMAYAIARAPERWRLPLLMAVILPFWTSFLIRVYAMIGILRPNGLLNQALQWLGVIEQPLNLLHNDPAVVVGIAYAYLPFMVLPLYAVLAQQDRNLIDAAADLGAGRWRRFVTITLPLSLPGIAGGCLLVFIPAVGEFVIPALLGGPDTLMVGRVIWNEFFVNGDWPRASALAVVMLLILVVPLLFFERLLGRRS